MKKQIIIIAGPTAVGKTEYAIETAKAINGEIVSADSMQLYKYMDIGSAKPTAEELSQVKILGGAVSEACQSCNQRDI